MSPSFSHGSRQVERSVVFSSRCHGVCSITDISVLLKGGVIWHKCHFTCCVQGSCSTRYCELCSHQLAQTQQTVLCCQWISRSSNQCWVFGCWLGSGSSFQGSRQLDWLFWPGCLWKYVSWGPHVCANQNLATLAPQSEHNTEVICHLLCPGCLGLISTGYA